MSRQPLSALAHSKEECERKEPCSSSREYEHCEKEEEREPCYDEMNVHKHYYGSKDCYKDYDKQCYKECNYGGNQESCVSIGTILIWFIVVAIITWLLLFAFNPDFIQERDANGQPTGEIDHSQLLLWTAVISLVVTFIIWIILKLRGSGGYGWNC